MPAAPDAVLFDLDGTLADTAPDLSAALNAVLRARGKAELPAGVLRPHVSAGARGLIGAGFGISPGDAEFPALRNEFLAHYERRICDQTILFPGIDALLLELDCRRRPWGIVTNKPQRFALPVIEALDLRHRAACIVCGDSASRAKPDPQPMQLACEILCCRPVTSVYVGDDRRDIQAGRSAGMIAVAAAWGYLGTEHPIVSWGADFIAASPEEISLAWLRRGT